MKELARSTRWMRCTSTRRSASYNDANGLVDGMNCMEGSLALAPRTARRAAGRGLSGEGLNEVTGQLRGVRATPRLGHGPRPRHVG